MRVTPSWSLSLPALLRPWPDPPPRAGLQAGPRSFRLIKHHPPHQLPLHLTSLFSARTCRLPRHLPEQHLSRETLFHKTGWHRMLFLLPAALSPDSRSDDSLCTSRATAVPPSLEPVCPAGRCSAVGAAVEGGEAPGAWRVSAPLGARGAGGEGVGAHWVAELATCHAPGPRAQNLAWPPWATDQGCSVLSAPFPPPLPSHCHD